MVSHPCSEADHEENGHAADRRNQGWGFGGDGQKLLGFLSFLGLLNDVKWEQHFNQMTYDDITQVRSNGGLLSY